MNPWMSNQQQSPHDEGNDNQNQEHSYYRNRAASHSVLQRPSLHFAHSEPLSAVFAGQMQNSPYNMEDNSIALPTFAPALSNTGFEDIPQYTQSRHAEPWNPYQAPPCSWNSPQQLQQPQHQWPSGNSMFLDRDAMSDPGMGQASSRRMSSSVHATPVIEEDDSGYDTRLPSSAQSQRTNDWETMEVKTQSTKQSQEKGMMSPPPKPSPLSVKSGTTPRKSRTSSKASTGRQHSTAFYCSAPGCNKLLKNPSDARKHEHTHTKPYCCDYDKCKRGSAGFATKNDLDRHRKSVHGLTPSVGSKKGYVCVLCLRENPDKKPKWWPRLDNFKAHVTRKHKDANKDEVAKSSEQDMRPDDAQTAYTDNDSGYVGAMSQPDATDPHYQAQLMNSEFSDITLGQAFPQELLFAHMDPTNTAIIPEIQISPPLDQRQPMLKHQLSAHTRLASPPSNGDNRISPSNGGSIDNTMSATGGTGNSTSPIGSKTSNGTWKCKFCGTEKLRECDLRKHCKRHTRPYGCTFPKCHKRFGSRNDWKRHEKSQHFLLEMWVCPCERANCLKVYHSQASYRKHLEATGYKENTLPIMMDSMHLGREANERYWCGLCGDRGEIRTVEREQYQGLSAWQCRLQHIGDHFDKHGRTIDEWFCVEGGKRKSQLRREEKPIGASSRKSSINTEEADDSDLGEDGIPGIETDQVPYGIGGRYGDDEDADAEYDGEHDQMHYA